MLSVRTNYKNELEKKYRNELRFYNNELEKKYSENIYHYLTFVSMISKQTGGYILGNLTVLQSVFRATCFIKLSGFRLGLSVSLLLGQSDRDIVLLGILVSLL